MSGNVLDFVFQTMNSSLPRKERQLNPNEMLKAIQRGDAPRPGVFGTTTRDSDANSSSE